jgi:hypothetical protein
MAERHLSPEQRRALSARARQIRMRGQLEGWSRDRIVDEIQRELPEVLPLEAHRFAHGWTRIQLSQALDRLYEADGLMPPQISVSEICRWEHGRHQPNPERQEYLTRLYRTTPPRLGFGKDYSREESPGPVARPADAQARIRPGPGDRIAAMNWRTGSSGPELLVEVEDGDLDGRAVLVLGGGAVPWAGDGLPEAVVDRLGALADALGEVRHAVPPGLLLTTAEAYVGCLGELEALGPGERLRALACLALLAAARAAAYAADPERSRRLHREAGRLAAEIDRPELAAQALVAQSLLHSRLLFGWGERDTMEALRLLEWAASLPAVLPAPLRAWLLAREAEELAAAGRRSAALERLARAREAAGAVRREECTGLFADWGPARLAAAEGRCRLLLGEAAEARACLEEAVAHTRSSDLGARWMLEVDLGAARIASGDADQGTVAIEEACRRALEIGQRAVLERALRARRRLGPGGHPAVAWLDERLGKLTGRAIA